jgi:hypothetical protein
LVYVFYGTRASMSETSRLLPIRYKGTTDGRNDAELRAFNSENSPEDIRGSAVENRANAAGAADAADSVLGTSSVNR